MNATWKASLRASPSMTPKDSRNLNPNTAKLAVKRTLAWLSLDLPLRLLAVILPVPRETLLRLPKRRVERLFTMGKMASCVTNQVKLWPETTAGRL